MGDRANIRVLTESDYTSGVFLYTHSMGYKMPKVLHKALSRRQRWSDGQYLTRIIFCEMLLEGGSLEGTTGYGISAAIGDNSYPVLTVDPDSQMVMAYENGRGFVLSFESFVGIEDTSWPGIRAHMKPIEDPTEKYPDPIRKEYSAEPDWTPGAVGTEIQTWSVASFSNSEKTYTVSRNTVADMMVCTCPDHVHRGRQCKHIQKVREEYGLDIHTQE